MLVRKPALRLCFLPFFKRNVLSFGGFFKVRMGERSVRIREVKGSNPSRSTFSSSVILTLLLFFCITTRTRQGRSKPFLEREGFGFFVFGGVPRRTTKASAAHGRAASAQAQCAADAYFLCRAPSPDGKVRASAAF